MSIKDELVPGLKKLRLSGMLKILDDLMASAAMDRLLHHAHVVVIEGHSYRNPPGGRKVA